MLAQRDVVLHGKTENIGVEFFRFVLVTDKDVRHIDFHGSCFPDLYFMSHDAAVMCSSLMRGEWAFVRPFQVVSIKLAFSRTARC